MMIGKTASPSFLDSIAAAAISAICQPQPLLVAGYGRYRRMCLFGDIAMKLPHLAARSGLVAVPLRPYAVVEGTWLLRHLDEERANEERRFRYDRKRAALAA